jgi:NAD(P)-dependent dehydrogenase (short-subunit alcohol dehydrogenase family)
VLLRPGLLEGVSVLLALAAPVASPEGTVGAAVSEACAALGAKVSTCVPDAADEAALDVAIAAAARAAGQIDLLAVDGAGLFANALARGGGDGHVALRTCMDATWNVTRATANHAFLAPAQTGPGRAAERGGGSPESSSHARRIVYLAPAPDAGEYAPAVCAGLENLARTLSIEWARHGIATVAIAPGASTPASEVAALTAYLASPAGAYFSGCLLDLRGV